MVHSATIRETREAKNELTRCISPAPSSLPKVITKVIEDFDAFHMENLEG